MLVVCVYCLPLKTLSHEHTVERDRDANWRQGHTKQSFPKEPQGLRAIFIPRPKNHIPGPQAPGEREELSASLKHFKFHESLGCLQSSEVDLRLGKQD